MAASDKKQNTPQHEKDFQNKDKSSSGQPKASFLTARPITKNAQPDYPDEQSTDEKDSPYDSQNPRQESGSQSKDITEKDIEKDLIEHDPSEGFETDIDTQNSSEEQSDTFETIEPQEDNPVRMEFEIGKLTLDELQEDELKRDETTDGAVHFNKPSQRKF